jgi:hypothetical protein
VTIGSEKLFDCIVVVNGGFEPGNSVGGEQAVGRRERGKGVAAGEDRIGKLHLGIAPRGNDRRFEHFLSSQQLFWRSDRLRLFGAGGGDHLMVPPGYKRFLIGAPRGDALRGQNAQDDQDLEQLRFRHLAPTLQVYPCWVHIWPDVGLMLWLKLGRPCETTIERFFEMWKRTVASCCAMSRVRGRRLSRTGTLTANRTRRTGGPWPPNPSVQVRIRQEL